LRLVAVEGIERGLILLLLGVSTVCQARTSGASKPSAAKVSASGRALRRENKEWRVLVFIFRTWGFIGIESSGWEWGEKIFRSDRSMFRPAPESANTQ
jgi:hypothetical protein